MVFSSFPFILAFLPVVLIVYYALSHIKNDLYQRLFLILASLFFYGYQNVNYLALIIASIAVNYIIAIVIQRTEKRISKLFLVLGILFNVLLIPVFGKLRVSFFQNMRSMILSVIGMYAIGLYCNLIFRVLVSAEKAWDINSMFIIHSPFGPSFLRYPVIAALALVLYFILFTICDLIKNPKGTRWFNRKTN